MIVLDASAALDLVLRQDPWRVIASLASSHEVASPELLLVEGLQALRRLESTGDLSAIRADQAVEDLLDLPVALHRHRPVARWVWSLRADITAYDATYVALATALEVPLVTTDRRLARTAARHCPVADL